MAPEQLLNLRPQRALYVFKVAHHERIGTVEALKTLTASKRQGKRERMKLLLTEAQERALKDIVFRTAIHRDPLGGKSPSEVVRVESRTSAAMREKLHRFSALCSLFCVIMRGRDPIKARKEGFGSG